MDEMIVHRSTVKAKARKAKLEGREHLVVPVVMLRVGVWNGTAGPIFYPKEVLEASASAWNHKPVVVYHPEIGGKPVSAALPEVLSDRKVGVVLNSRVEGEDLKADVWIDVQAAKRVDERVLHAVQQAVKMDVSTGLLGSFASGDQQVHNGKTYTVSATAIQPDHLALLPDKDGACAVPDGCGLFQNKRVGNESHRQIHDALMMSLRAMLGETYSGWWIVDVFESFCIYRDGSKLWLVNYAMQDGAAVLLGTPVEVLYVSEYRMLDGTVIEGSTSVRNEETKVAEENKQNAAPIAPAPGGCPDVKTAPVTNAEPKQPSTVAEVIANAPEAMREVLSAGVKLYEDQRESVIVGILGNKANVFTRCQLATKGMEELKAIAALAAVSNAAPNYAGQGQPANATAAVEEPLSLPKMTFTK